MVAVGEASVEERVICNIHLHVHVAVHTHQLTLRVVGGLSTDEIAKAFLAPKSTVAQRIVRAKKTLSGAAFEVPDRSEWSHRMSTVLSVIYLIFNEGYVASSGRHWFREDLCEEELRLGRVLAALAPTSRMALFFPSGHS